LSDGRSELAALYERDYPRLVRFAFLLVGDGRDAEEVVQDAYVSVFKSWRRIEDQEKAGAYVMKSVVNGCRSRLRRRRLESLPLPLDGAGIGRHLPASSVLTRHDVLALIATLPLRQREVVFLRYYLDRSEEQIARAMGVTRGAVKTHGSRAVGRLRLMLEGLECGKPPTS
jgi:RNA polymerase sigma-70 factor (sigma-E family)